MSPSPTPANRGLADAVVSFRLSEEAIQNHLESIHQDVLGQSRYVRDPDFKMVHPNDLKFLFGAYDERFFGGLCKRALDGRSINFRLSPRMTRAGGKTTRFKTQTGEVSYEIAIGISMLFDGFRNMDRRISVCGLGCENRLRALQRIFEHEMVHLTELLCWQTSDCAAARFQDIAQRLFLHRAHTHDLVTRRERAAESGIRIGSPVTFEYEGRRLNGRVNRITKRVTVLVEDHNGELRSDGLRYKVYYVPISGLTLVLRPCESES